MLSYLIPKSARNVKLQLFKGMGMVEVGFLLGGVVLGVLVMNTSWELILKIIFIFILIVVIMFLVSPSFISNKKGYQSFEIIFNYWASHKLYRKREKVIK